MAGFNCQLLFTIWFTIKQYTEKPQRRTDCATGIPFGHHASKAHWLAMICVLSPQKGNLSHQSLPLWGRWIAEGETEEGGTAIIPEQHFGEMVRTSSDLAGARPPSPRGKVLLR